jgi:hypothetical protein
MENASHSDTFARTRAIAKNLSTSDNIALWWLVANDQGKAENA